MHEMANGQVQRATNRRVSGEPGTASVVVGMASAHPVELWRATFHMALFHLPRAGKLRHLNGSEKQT